MLWLSGILALPFVVYLVVVGNPASWVALAVSLFAVVAYSFAGLRFKERPVLDSLTSSTHFVSPAVYGLLLACADFTPALFALLAAFFLWGAASHAFGAVQDVVADREGGIGSIATVIGARRTVRLSVVLYLLAGILLLATEWPGPLRRRARAALCDQRRRLVAGDRRNGAHREPRVAPFPLAQLRHRIRRDDAADRLRLRALSAGLSRGCGRIRSCSPTCRRTGGRRIRR